MSGGFPDPQHLGKIESDGKKIAEWQHVSPIPDVRLHFEPHGKPGSGFNFCCVYECGSDDDGALYDVWFNGVAFFDGVRHLHFVGLEHGYFNYPHLEEMGAALAALHKLEMEQCPYLSA